MYCCVGEISAGIAAFVLKGELKDVIQKKMTDGMQNYGKQSIITVIFIVYEDSRSRII